jgi:hypothetical protein
MAATEVFSMQNNFTQAGSVGICTCISLNWARRVLIKGSGVKTYSEIGLSDLTMNAQMSVLRRLDSDPAGQCDLVDLEMVGAEITVASVDDIVRNVKKTSPHIAIFWTNTHTMGYRYAHNEKEFFDNEIGLYSSKNSKDIKAKMKAVTNGYGGVRGMRIVKLKS